MVADDTSPLSPHERGFLLRAAIVLAVGGAIWLAPAPTGLAPHAWRYFALFAAVVAALILQPVPGPVAGLLGIIFAAALRMVVPTAEASMRWALSGFAHGTVWLIFVAFMLGLGYERTGLGRRIALSLVRALGRRTLGLGYAVALADLALAPFTPSNTARSGGMVFPVLKSIPALYGSAPGASARRIGAYLMWTAFAATGITSSMFLTANAANLFAASVLKDALGIHVGWGEWALGFGPVGLLLFASLPVLVYLLYPPEVTRSEEVPVWAALELARLGPVTRPEVTMAAIATAALGLWIFAGAWLNATLVALMALAAMILTRVLDWGDVLGYKEAWNVLAWFGTLLTLADGLREVGFLPWFAARTAAAGTGLPPPAALVLLVSVFFASHYLFASLTAHATAMLPALLAAGAAMPGMPTRPLALALCYAVGLMGVLNPYATGPAPIYFGAGYITRGEFWRLGAVFGAIFLASLLGLGVPWLLAIAR